MAEHRDVSQAEVAILAEGTVDRLWPVLMELTDGHELSPCQAVTLMLHSLQAIHKGLHVNEPEEPEHHPLIQANDPQWS